MIWKNFRIPECKHIINFWSKILQWVDKSMISGWSGKGKTGCPVCLRSVHGFQLKHLENVVYMVQTIYFLNEMIYYVKIVSCLIVPK